MKTIEIDNKFGLLDMVLNQRKTQIREIVDIDVLSDNSPLYEVGDIVSIEDTDKSIRIINARKERLWEIKGISPAIQRLLRLCRATTGCRICRSKR